MMAQRRLLSEGPRFYNRVNELSLFGSVFKASPRLSVILGGPNVGKSVLCRRVLQDGEHNVAHIDLRTEGFSSAYELHLALQGQFARFSQSMKKLIPKSIGVPNYVRIELPQSAEKYSVGILSRDLKSVASTIPDWKV
jgi:AAA+ ATPase superfamily predicted ATPase